MTLFGAFQDLAGWRTRRIEAATLGALKAAVAGKDHRLAERLGHRSTLIILNQTIAPHGRLGDDSALSADDEVGFGPPVSGG